MSASWGVLPLDPTVPGFIDWLKQEGVDVPSSIGRYPTLDELLEALTIFDGQYVSKNHVDNNLWVVVIGELHSDTYAYMLGSVEENGLYNFHFFGSGCRGITMLLILKQLSSVCGPFVLYNSAFPSPPFIVTYETDIDKAMSEWYLQ